MLLPLHSHLFPEVVEDVLEEKGYFLFGLFYFCCQDGNISSKEGERKMEGAVSAPQRVLIRMLHTSSMINRKTSKEQIILKPMVGDTATSSALH